MSVLHHALLGVSVVALAVAGLRVASVLAERGLERVIAAAAFATAAAVGEAIVLGLVSLGGSTAALSAAALLTGAAAIAWLPRPAVGPVGELAEWWGARSQRERACLGALAGGALAWAAWQLRHPALGFDTVHYHLPEMVIFVQGGQPGSVHDVLPGLPVGNYPLTTEVTVAWAMGIARSYVPIVLLPWLTLALTATSAWAGLRALGTTRAAAGLAAAALCTNPWLLGWQSNGSVTDPPALAWLTACAALCALGRQRPALLAPAIVAGGLAIGCKTTVLPFTLVVLALGLWGARRRLPARAILLATAAATLVGGVWYLRNVVAHGSPFWPIVATPWGDPVPESVKAVHTSFLDRPRATIDLLGDSYLNRFGGGLLLLAGGALLAPILSRRRRVLVAAAATVGGLLVWARSPVTGIATSGALPETIFSTTRYALPVVAAACLALALAATDARGRLRHVALLALAGATGVNLVQTFDLGFPVAPSVLTPLAGAAVGAVLALAGSLLRRRKWPSPRRAAIRAAVPALVAASAGALLAIPAHGFVARHGDTRSVLVSIVVRDLAADPGFRDGSEPVATTPAYIGALAGDELRHRLVAIPPGTGCRDAVPRARREWLVVYGGPLGGVAPAAIKGCLPPPAFADGPFAVFRPPSARGR
jgi:hypothetical protein